MSKWLNEELHDLSLCFFCKNQASSTHVDVELYKLLKRSMVVASYTAKYATVRVQIPACETCRSIREKVGHTFFIVRVIAWMLSLPLLAFILQNYFEEVAFSWFLAIILATFLNLFLSVPLYAMFAGNKRVPSEQPSPMKYPLIERLIQEGWQQDVPNPKYGGAKGERLDEKTLDELHRLVLDNAQSTVNEFENESRTKFQHSVSE